MNTQALEVRNLKCHLAPFDETERARESEARDTTERGTFIPSEAEQQEAGERGARGTRTQQIAEERGGRQRVRGELAGTLDVWATKTIGCSSPPAADPKLYHAIRGGGGGGGA